MAARKRTLGSALTPKPVVVEEKQPAAKKPPMPPPPPPPPSARYVPPAMENPYRNLLDTYRSEVYNGVRSPASAMAESFRQLGQALSSPVNISEMERFALVAAATRAAQLAAMPWYRRWVEKLSDHWHSVMYDVSDFIERFRNGRT